MELTQPLVFEPLFMERVWGGRWLETLFGKKLPPGTRVGESWEIVDREEAQSVVHEGPLRGAVLNQLWTRHREEIFGAGLPDSPRFPLLFKLLDAQDRLSVQVHPPADIALAHGGEPKTEMWYLLDTIPGSQLYAGLNPGVTREAFERALSEGRAAEMVRSLPVKKGDAIFIPSGRIHAIGAGNLIFEAQQNSDTTYRVFDWNRVGLDGRLRELHLKESLRSIDFTDTDPQLATPDGDQLVECPYFRVERWALEALRRHGAERFAVYCVASGRLEAGGREFAAGDFFLVPATLADLALRPLESETTVLRTTIP